MLALALARRLRLLRFGCNMPQPGKRWPSAASVRAFNARASGAAPPDRPTDRSIGWQLYTHAELVPRIVSTGSETNFFAPAGERRF